MNHRFRVSSTLPRRLEELGLSPVVVLRQAGLPLGLFDQEKILLTTEEMFSLYRGIPANGEQFTPHRERRQKARVDCLASSL